MFDTSELKFNLEKMKKEYNENVGKRNALLESKQTKQTKLEEIEEYLITLEQTNRLLQKVSEHQRKVACQTIQELGTFALQTIFGPKFRLQIELKDGKKPEAEIYVISMENDREVKNTPQDSRGGGVVDVVSLTLQIVTLHSYEPRIDGPIFLDEPGKHVSSEHIEPLANFLTEISKKFDRQVIIITHNPYLANVAEGRFDVQLKNGVSKVTRL